MEGQIVYKIKYKLVTSLTGTEIVNQKSFSASYLSAKKSLHKIFDFKTLLTSARKTKIPLEA